MLIAHLKHGSLNQHLVQICNVSQSVISHTSTGNDMLVVDNELRPEVL